MARFLEDHATVKGMRSNSLNVRVINKTLVLYCGNKDLGRSLNMQINAAVLTVKCSPAVSYSRVFTIFFREDASGLNM